MDNNAQGEIAEMRRKKERNKRRKGFLGQRRWGGETFSTSIAAAFMSHRSSKKCRSWQKALKKLKARETFELDRTTKPQGGSRKGSHIARQSAQRAH